MSSEFESPSESEAALYGKAMAAAQALEEALGEVITLHEERLGKKRIAMTMGQLLSVLKARVPLRGDLDSDLSNALSIRNRLAHMYFREARSGEAGARNLTTLRSATSTFLRLTTEVASLVAAYSYTTSKDQEFFLHQRAVTLRGGEALTIFFFAREKKRGVIPRRPAGYSVVETATGLPILKKA